MERIVKSVVITLIFLALAAASSAWAGGAPGSQSHWVVQKSPSTANLFDISCASASECFAVGAKAAILKTVDGGKTWRMMRSSYGNAHPSASFVSVRCPTTGVCSVLAAPNIVLHTTDSGRTWQQHTISLPSLLSRLGRLACPTRPICFATASPSGNTETWFNHSAAIFKTSDGNKTWHRLTIPSSVPCPGDCNARPVGFDLQWISCQNGQSCRAGGDTFIGSHEGFTSAVIRTDNGGKTWKLVHHDFDPNIATCPTPSVCTGIFHVPLSPNTDIDLMRSTNGGKAWSSKSITTVFTAIACSGTTFCELVGPHGKVAMAVTMSLFNQVSPTTHNLNAVACPRVDACYAVGAGGTILARKK